MELLKKKAKKALLSYFSIFQETEIEHDYKVTLWDDYRPCEIPSDY
jgi:hypothetical protein